MNYQVLLVDDDPDFLATFSSRVSSRGYQVDTASSRAEALELIKDSSHEYFAVVLDFNLGDGYGADLAREIKTQHPSQQIVIFSGVQAVSAVKDSILAGAVEYVEKTEGGLPRLLEVLELLKSKYDAEIRTLCSIRPDDSNRQIIAQELGMVGTSDALASVARQVRVARTTKEPVLILGATGVGKEMVAAAIHRGSEGKFVAVNCAHYAGKNDLMRSELFGHKRGSFSGAVADQLGSFRAADKGTLFLDEVHELDPIAAAQLLRATQERKVSPVGSSEVFPIRCRFITAAKDNIHELAETGEFKADLLYRLDFIRISIPPLRERLEDIDVLVEHFCNEFNKEHKTKKKFLIRTLSRLKTHDWPGNVRELHNTVVKMLLSTSDDTIRPDALPANFFRSSDSSTEESHRAPKTLEDLRKEYVKNERALIERTIRRTPSLRDAAESLGIRYTTFRDLKKKLGIKSPDRSSAVKRTDMLSSDESSKFLSD